MNREMERLRQDNQVLSFYSTSILSTATNILNGRVQGVEPALLQEATNFFQGQNPNGAAFTQGGVHLSGGVSAAQPTSSSPQMSPSSQIDQLETRTSTPPMPGTPPHVTPSGPPPTVPPTPRGQQPVYYSRQDKAWLEAPLVGEGDSVVSMQQ